MKLDLGHKVMDIGTFGFNFVRTLMVAGTGAAELNECLLAADAVKDGDPESWVVEWAALAERVRGSAERALAAQQALTARQAYFRASNYFRAAMLSMPHTDARLANYLTASRECFQVAAKLSSPVVERLDVPFNGATLPGYFLSAGGRARPTLVVVNGGDSTNEEMVHWLGFAAVARGWNLFVFEGPGQWSAMQLNPDLHLRPDYEVPTKAVLDLLVQRAEVDPERIALYGLSLGSLLAARIAAFEPRIKACVCQGLVVDVYEAWHAVWPKILQSAPPGAFSFVFSMLEKLSPQLRGLTGHFRWMLGKKEPFELIEAWRPYNVSGLSAQIKAPMLVLYGEAEAAQSNEIVALSALRFVNALPGPVSMHMFGYDEGWASTHCQMGALAPLQAVVFDWLEKAMNAPASLPRRAMGGDAAVFPRYLRSPEARRVTSELLDAAHATAKA
ncbi:MAG TPA: alpha/beta hydrolase [Kofleriaceae bacterium]|jgi:pimeloyl-ACP methyl ester carboxylesterase|nr:alpha/beta hydrolase [Kofleriaceae bacterium]